MAEFELKALHPNAIGSAQERAVRYRLLNEPRLAESICRDILRVDEDNREAVITLILALTDQYGREAGMSVGEAMELIGRLEDDFDRLYYSGIVCERRAKAQLKILGSGSGPIAYDWFRRAMDYYDDAEEVSPPGNDDAVLRWNTCARIINKSPEVRPAPDEHVQHLLE